jgi:death-on-curing family protein
VQKLHKLNYPGILDSSTVAFYPTIKISLRNLYHCWFIIATKLLIFSTMDNPQPENKGEIVIYKDQEGPELRVTLADETVWLTQSQIAGLFEKDVRTISDHIRNIFKEAELSQNSVIRKFRITAKDGKTYNVEHYNLDVIISVGYRVRSKRGTQFRIWATQRLRDYILQGYLLNEQRLKERTDAKLKELQSAVQLLQRAIESRRLEGYEKELLNIITDYTSTWILLNKYDKDELKIENVTKKVLARLRYEKVKKSIEQFKERLIKTKQASPIFGREVEHKLEAILGNIEQTYQRKPLYGSLEEKAAHLFYFVIKDHPFADGNKRIGSLLFLLYLVENHHVYNKRGERIINDTALTALALLIAESKPSHKNTMIKLVVNMIAKK